MEEPRRLTLEEIDERHPRLIQPFVLIRMSVGSSCAPRNAGPSPSEDPAAHYLADGIGRGRRSARSLRPNAPTTCCARRVRARRGHHGRQLLRPGARGGLCVRGADLVPRGNGRPRRSRSSSPRRAPLPDDPIIGAAEVHGVLAGWRQLLQGNGPGRHVAGCLSMNLVWSMLIIVVATALR